METSNYNNACLQYFLKRLHPDFFESLNLAKMRLTANYLGPLYL